MSSLSTIIRRMLLLVAVTAAGGLAFNWWRERSAGGEVIEPPEWPPLQPVSEAATPARAPAAAANAPEETSSGFVAPTADGSCPGGYPVKLKTSSGIFHVPGGRFYDRTVPDRCYSDAAAAEADGYRQSKS